MHRKQHSFQKLSFFWSIKNQMYSHMIEGHSSFENVVTLSFNYQWSSINFECCVKFSITLSSCRKLYLIVLKKHWKCNDVFWKFNLWTKDWKVTQGRRVDRTKRIWLVTLFESDNGTLLEKVEEGFTLDYPLPPFNTQNSQGNLCRSPVIGNI